MDMPLTLYVSNREDWRAWLARNHAGVSDVWLIFYRPGTGQASLPYEDAVEEALCFGWIDSLIQRIDEASYARKFTPRKAGSQWSAANKRRVAKLIREGRMTDFGLARVDYPHPEQAEDAPAAQPELPIPPPVRQALMADPLAWQNFNHLAPSYRRQYIGWITSAKREETRARRIAEAVERLRQGRKLGME